VTVQGPRTVTGSQMAALRRDQDAGGVTAVGPKRPGDQLLVVTYLACIAVVRIRGVDHRHAGVEGRMDGRDRPFSVGSTFDRHRHAAETDRGDRAWTDQSLLHRNLSYVCQAIALNRRAPQTRSPTTEFDGMQKDLG
jgi:hypothetical protein